MLLIQHLNTLETTGLLRLATVQPELEYLFRHALVQDAAYGSLLKNDRRQLHQNVGEALERLYPQQRDELAATLALHFEKAEQHDKAVHYFQRAGELASEGFANAEALAFYQAAIGQAELALQHRPDEQWQRRLTELLESLADVHERIGQHETAREAYYRALKIQGNLPTPDNVMQARLHRKIGTAHMLQRQMNEASQAWEQAEQYLGALSDPQPDARGNEWIELQQERLMYHYWLNDIPGMEAICDRLLPVVERVGTLLQRSRTLYSYNLYVFRMQRYVVSDELMAANERNLLMVEQVGKLTITFDHYFTCGFFHLFRRELDEAEKHLQLCLQWGQQMGDPVRISRAANYLMLAARMRGQAERMTSYFETVLSTTWAGPMADYNHAVQGCKAWMAWRAGKLEEARAYGLQAHATYLGPILPFPFQWIAYFPLLAVAVTEKQCSEAIEYAQRMLDPKQMILPEALTALLNRAIQLGVGEQPDAALQTFTEALTLATQMGYV